ncbi:MAG TPA: NAD(P)-dependent oxidoreductase [Candidatus Baltobacteraceae bacterium]|nr:NAD(P)-dependent oxidoreductase [Candidatus Baltobacteraceae bacterium]
MPTGLPRLGIVGVGRMGANIALALHDAGYLITAVYDARPDAAREVASAVGSVVAPTLAFVSQSAEVILTVVSDDRAQEAVYATSSDSLLEHCSGKTFINCATLSPKIHVDIERLCRQRSADSLEVCMAGSIPQARNGTLYLMVGGRLDVFERTRPLLQCMGSSVRYIGPAGEAAKVKALVNMVMNSNTVALAEGLGLGAALGLDLTLLREVFAQTGANSRVLETDGADMQSREHDTYFSAAHAAKDSHIAIALARELGLDVPVAEATAAQYDRMINLGLGELDKSGIAELTFPSRVPTHGV